MARESGEANGRSPCREPQRPRAGAQPDPDPGRARGHRNGRPSAGSAARPVPRTFSPEGPRGPGSPFGPPRPLGPSGPSSPRGPGGPISPWRSEREGEGPRRVHPPHRTPTRLGPRVLKPKRPGPRSLRMELAAAASAAPPLPAAKPMEPSELLYSPADWSPLSTGQGQGRGLVSTR